MLGNQLISVNQKELESAHQILCQYQIDAIIIQQEKDVDLRGLNWGYFKEKANLLTLNIA